MKVPRLSEELVQEPHRAGRLGSLLGPRGASWGLLRPPWALWSLVGPPGTNWGGRKQWAWGSEGGALSQPVDQLDSDSMGPRPAR